MMSPSNSRRVSASGLRVGKMIDFRGGGPALRVIGIGGKSEPDPAFIDLVHLAEKGKKSGRFSDGGEKKARGQRVQRPEVSDLFLDKNSSQRRDDIMRVIRGGFPDEDQAVHQSAEAGLF